MRKLACTLTALILTLAACSTEPAKNVTHDSATLVAEGACDMSLSQGNAYTVTGWFEWRVKNTAAWTEGPRETFDCPAGDPGNQQTVERRYTGFTSSTTYEYRLAFYGGGSTGSVQRMDSNRDGDNQANGTDYDTFTTAAPPADPEIARGDPATASSTHASAGPPSYANDGSATTRWSSSYTASGSWWRVDLGARYTLSKVEVDWEDATANPYYIEVSDDGAAWTRIATQSITTDLNGYATPRPTVRTTLTGTGRYVRILQGGRGPGNCCYGISFWEARVYGVPASPTPPADTDGDGVADSSDLCPGTPAGTPVDPTGCPMPGIPPNDFGHVRVAKPHQGDMDSYTVTGNQKNPDGTYTAAALAMHDFYQQHYDRLRYYNSPPQIYGTDWLPPGWMYKDAYAVYNSPNGYVLKDTSGNYLRIPFTCSDGTRCQYAANVCDPAWRSQWISTAVADATKFHGLFADDFNVLMKVAGATGPDVWETGGPTPVNYLDGTTLTRAEWEDCMATFAEQIDAGVGALEWVPNTVPFHAGGITNPQVQRVIKAADFWELERGTLQNGAFADRFADAQYAHSQGRGVVLDFQADPAKIGLTEAQVLEYERASFLCMNEGKDFVGGLRMTPGNWWTGWDVDLGAATSNCTKQADGVTWKRTFTGGTVTLNSSTFAASVTTN